MSLNCNKSFEIDFLCDLVVDNTMHSETDPSLINEFSVAVNSDKLYLYTEEIEYNYAPGDEITIPNPCPSKGDIIVDTVLLNALKAKGVLSYVVAVNLLKTSDNVVVTPPEYKNGWHSVSGNVYIDDEIVSILDTLNEPYEIKIEVKEIEIQVVSFVPEMDQYIYRINGKFNINSEPVIIP